MVAVTDEQRRSLVPTRLVSVLRTQFVRKGTEREVEIADLRH